MQRIINQPHQGATLFLITRRAFAKKKEVAPWKETKILIAGCQG